MREEEIPGVSGDGSGRICSVCSLGPECISWSLDRADYDELGRIVSHPPALDEGKHLFQVGDLLTSVYAVRTGTFKTYAFDSLGKEYVLRFVFPGELLGFDGVYARRHGCNAVAVEGSTVCALPYFDLASLMEDSVMLREQILRLASQGFGDRVVNARLTPEARFANLLLDFHRRTGNGDGSEPMCLPMPSYDLANYLRVTEQDIEGMFAHYMHRKIIDFHGNRLVLLDPDGLKHAASKKNSE